MTINKYFIHKNDLNKCTLKYFKILLKLFTEYSILWRVPFVPRKHPTPVTVTNISAASYMSLNNSLFSLISVVVAVAVSCKYVRIKIVNHPYNFLYILVHENWPKFCLLHISWLTWVSMTMPMTPIMTVTMSSCSSISVSVSRTAEAVIVVHWTRPNILKHERPLRSRDPYWPIRGRYSE